MAKQELLTTIPSDPEARKALSKLISAGAEVIKEIKGAQEDLKAVISNAKESLGYDPKFIKTLIDFEYDKQQAAEKKRAELEAKVERVNELDILMGRSDVAVSSQEEEEE